MDPEREVRDLRARLSRQARAVRDVVLSRGTARFDRLPGPLQQASRLIWRTGRAAVHDRLPGLAAEAALFTLISLPALLLAVIGSLGFVAAALGPQGTAELSELVLGIPESFLSDPTYAAYENAVQTVLAETRGGVVSLSLALSLWTGSRAVNRYLETITIVYGVEPRPGWRRRLLALGLTIAALAGAVAVLPPMVIGPRLVRWLAPDAIADTTLRALDLMFWPSVILVVLVGLATLYHIGVPWKTPWRRDLPGAVLAVALWVLASAGLRAYLTFSVADDAIFSQLAVPLAVVLWLWVTGIVILLGAEFNAEIERMWPHEDHPWRITSLRDRLIRHR
ncbi:YihY/virulence factor BrkB family protein [Mycobacterium sp. PSTR-4-N]|uniref:YihY/virulence factor BrkB family protein n=1 Tax=Mycobacterium sp. PSTR-4-N TaxID=2917745 RepID=UPI001F14F663|nr:YihY/virulence factor BrkB family protein [Mycobacterium sp. PSTR-4-N]MCG7595701.1 YihY/virulence factor BrkB family protein [Mycobacterium sp. PSTR-4-N]